MMMATNKNKATKGSHSSKGDRKCGIAGVGILAALACIVTSLWYSGNAISTAELLLYYANQNGTVSDRYAIIQPPTHTPEEHYDNDNESSNRFIETKDSDFSFALAPQQSYGYLMDISNHAWRQLQQRAGTTRQFRFPSFPERAFGVPLRWYMKNLQPVLTCPAAERIGAFDNDDDDDDGAFWTCDPYRLEEANAEVGIEAKETDNPNNIRAAESVSNHSVSKTTTCLIYSIGYSGPWEEHIIRRLPHCQMHIIDPAFSATVAPLNHPNVHWHPWRLHSTQDSDSVPTPDDDTVSYLTLPEIRQRLGTDDQSIDILKIDCGAVCAWSTYRDWSTANATQILWQATGLPSPKEGNAYHPAGPLRFSHVFALLQAQGYIMFAKDYRHRGPRVALGYLRLHPDFWHEARQFAEQQRQKQGASPPPWFFLILFVVSATRSRQGRYNAFVMSGNGSRWK